MSAWVLAPIAVAQDPAANLKAAIDAARSDGGCPPFQNDAILNDVSARATHEVDAWINHTGKTLPVSDTIVPGVPGLMQALREKGYNPGKAKMLSGYGDYRTGGPGDNEAKAIAAALLQGEAYAVFSDCSYKKYGLSALSDDSPQGWPSAPPRSYFLTTVTVTGD
jgi:hypothetical protein